MPALKTYGRKRVHVQPITQLALPVSAARSVFDALLAKNVEKRNSSIENEKKIVTRSRKKQIDKLPTGPTQLADNDSLSFIANTTFDKLLKAPGYNSVKYRNLSSLLENTSTEKSSPKKIKTSVKLKTNVKNTDKKVKKLRKISKRKNNKHKLAKSFKLTINSFTANNNKSVTNLSKVQNSYDKSINHSLIIEKEHKKQRNYYDLSKIILEEKLNTIYTRKFASNSCSSNVIPELSLSNNKSDFFQNGFQHRMCAESTPKPKILLSSTPISRNFLKVDDKIDVSPITTKNSKSFINCKSRFLSFYDKSTNFQKLTNPLLKSSLINNQNSKVDSLQSSTSSIISINDSKLNNKSPRVYKRKVAFRYSTNSSSIIGIKKKSRQPLFSSVISVDDSNIEYESLLPHNIKRLSNIIANDIKLNAIPVVVIEQSINWPIKLNNQNLHDISNFKTKYSPKVLLEELSESFLRKRNQCLNNQNNTGSQIVPFYDSYILSSPSTQHVMKGDFKRKYSPKIVLENLSLSRLNKCTKQGNPKVSIDTVRRKRTLQRSKSEPNLSSVDLFSSSDETTGDIFEIPDEDSNYHDNSNKTSSDIIENSRNSDISNHYYITTRNRRRLNPAPTKEQSPKGTQKFLSVSVVEFEQFTQNNIKHVEIDDSGSTSKTISPRLKQTEDKSKRKLNQNQDIAQVVIKNNSIIKMNDNNVASSNSARINKDDKICDKVSGKYNTNVDTRKSICLRPGKQWFRSLSMLRHSALTPETCNNKGRKYRQSVNDIHKQQTNKSTLNTIINDNEIRNLSGKQRSSVVRHSLFKIVPINTTRSYNSLTNFENSSLHNSGYVSTLADESILESFDKLSLTADVDDREQTARQIILKRCGQTTPLPFNECYTQRTLKKCRKIGEGVYGEVFMYKSLDDKCRVMKIIPIEGSLVVNGEQQKKFEEIISEIIIASELSKLRTNTTFGTDGFAELLKICCVQGKYPQQLIDLWDLYDEHQGSENDSPEVFADDQLYIILELANGGQDLEAYRFNNADQTYALFTQVVCSLAVAESALEFEHRDMHWGNILISSTEEPTATFRFNNREFEVATKGVKLSIIDYTLSRMTFNKCFIFNDLGLDPDLFTATGDYQFEIYRLMRNHNQNDWQRFEPFSNILWLDYTLEKMIGHLRYLRVTTKVHKTGIRRLSQLRKKVLSYNSATELLNSDVFSHVFL